MAENTMISIYTEQIAYPLSSQYYPQIRVFEAPYSVGDCPIDEITLSSKNSTSWYALSGDILRAEIDDSSVTLHAEEGREYTIGKEYEVRVYQSDWELDQ